MIDEKSELVSEIETFLAMTVKREMFTSTEVQDLLLDLINLAEPKLN